HEPRHALVDPHNPSAGARAAACGEGAGGPTDGPQPGAPFQLHPEPGRRARPRTDRRLISAASPSEQVTELVKSPLPAAEHERHEHTAQRPEPVLAKVLAIGEQEELPFAVQCPPGLIVHEDLAIAAEFEVSQSVARHLPLA